MKKTLKQLKENKDDTPHCVINRYTNEVISKHPNKKAANIALADTYRMKSEYSVMPEGEKYPGTK